MSAATLTVESLGRRGEGLARGEAGPIYVPYALPGETVTAEVDGETARLIAVQSASPQRIAPFCPYFGRCGGCLLQHYEEGAYRLWKTGLVRSAFHQRGLDVPVAPLVDAHGEGRRRVALHVRKREGVVTAGFMALRSHALQNISACPIVVPALARGADMARAIGAAAGDCDVSLTATQGGLDAFVKVERKVAARQQPLLARLAGDLDLARLTVNGDTLALRRAPAVSVGRATVTLPPLSFLQATEAGEQALAGLVTGALRKARHVADLFCGVGPFALRLAERVRVSGFDSDASAIAALAESACRTPGLKPVATQARDLFRAPLVAGELKEFDTVVFDPPRAGAEAQAHQLARSTVNTVIAVSCDPAALARDAAILVAGGYRIESVTPVDQFKYSPHVETVAVFRRK